jgi:hypothetical protein
MRLVEEGFGESIPAAVIRVYSVDLTVAGEASLRGATHLEQLPKILTSAVSSQVRAVLAGRGPGKFGAFLVRARRQAIQSRIFSPQKNLVNFDGRAAAGWALIRPIRSMNKF